MNGDDAAWLTPQDADVDRLPQPSTLRWQPLRLGLVDLFHYDDEQFWFHDGRLLLRGNNGTGKSKVLALTLPLLLDGSLQPRRVEPDADPKKKMEWNLLLGGAHPHSERTGYTWLEFGRRDEEGAAHFLTLGLGLKAAAGRGIVKHWYFLTSRRIGDLRLLDPARTVLSAERLNDELGADGQVLPTRDGYRRAVDEALFRLGEERYAALVDLLIGLRQPQLSKRPDEKALSAALTEALAPLDQAVLADVAESFRSLEEERAGIADGKETLAAAGDFLRHYRAYAQVATRRHTTAVRVANSTYEHAGRDLVQAEGELDGARAAEVTLEAAQRATGERRGELAGQEEALRTSPEMRDAERLHAAAEDADKATRIADQAEAAARVARERAEREQASADAATRRAEETAAAARGHDDAALASARRAGLAPDHPGIAHDADAARTALDRRRGQVRHVRNLLAAAQLASAQAEQQRAALDTAETTAAGRAEDVRAAEKRVDADVAAYRDAARAYVAQLVVIRPEPTVEELLDHAEDWARSPMAESPLRSALDVAARKTVDRLSRAAAEADHEAGRIEQLLAQTRSEIAELEGGRDPAPALAPARDPGARAAAPGAPLWRLVDFAADVADADRAGLEAALQSAGLLDAWVFPDGTVQARDDVVLASTGSGSVERSLAGLLVPAIDPDSGVGAQLVTDVLERIGLGEDSGAALWIELSGGWGAGPARGSWSKARAEHIGAGAREAHRRLLLESLAVQLGEQEQDLITTQARASAAEQQITQARREESAYPAAAERAVAAAHDGVAHTLRELERAQVAVDGARAAWEAAATTAERAADELAEAAADLGTGSTAAELDDLGEAVAAYEVALTELRGATEMATAAASGRRTADERAQETARIANDAEQDARTARAEAVARRSRADELQQTVGASVAELQARLAEVSAAARDVEQEIERLVQHRMDAGEKRARLEQKVEDLGRRREEVAEERAVVVGTLRGFVQTGLLRVALPEMERPEDHVDWNVTTALALARATEQLLEDVDESDDAWGRAQQRVSRASTELAAQMSRHGHTSSMLQQGDVMVARVRYRSEETDVDLLAKRLADDVADRERLLSAREREILETYLVDEVAGHLHELLHAADTQLDAMNRELAARKTSTGMQLRVRWRECADGPPGLRAVRDLLVRSDATWAPADRAAIGEFLQARIAEVRQTDPAGSWQEHLERALDYRHWHDFVVERWQNGQWRSAAGPASGGEKALAVSVPLFAAAAAHYNSAAPHAPRLILLDEAFAGVDDDSRAKSLGLLATFDLDVVMTSEREWGCYPQVPGLAIAQLSRVEGVDAVGVTRWRWNGRLRERVADVDDAARAGGAAVASETDESLFA
ncbi:TIGR02680 family protein [Nocardioides massiliensis]|uniref:Uncharacterized protein (TIGR02680 family) n=1 Tax=Nocardioides massiliensis TaxID=1325935 RepID=A0ABT9NN52_9ACTN|nr:TIGR02680 family protein [Nocardioides massiliensis]MDP9821672.1 uncharacterized protein (TIGR02680 family) [Nocardioides massiliensis]